MRNCALLLSLVLVAFGCSKKSDSNGANQPADVDSFKEIDALLARTEIVVSVEPARFMAQPFYTNLVVPELEDSLGMKYSALTGMCPLSAIERVTVGAFMPDKAAYPGDFSLDTSIVIRGLTRAQVAACVEGVASTVGIPGVKVTQEGPFSKVAEGALWLAWPGERTVVFLPERGTEERLQKALEPANNLRSDQEMMALIKEVGIGHHAWLTARGSAAKDAEGILGTATVGSQEISLQVRWRHTDAAAAAEFQAEVTSLLDKLAGDMPELQPIRARIQVSVAGADATIEASLREADLALIAAQFFREDKSSAKSDAKKGPPGPVAPEGTLEPDPMQEQPVTEKRPPPVTQPANEKQPPPAPVQQ